MSAKSIMVQGTMSGVGKSLLVAALCRIFAQDGLSVAPFKSQNMALNSGITATGAEMGRAQIMQAECAGVQPEAAMNPILLKPTSDVGSQVIVNGQARANMTAREYFAYKSSLKGDIRRAYDSLASRFDVVVIEGAGSPAEVNLKTDDIVNMGMARMAKSPVLLVGDIDRGGVFAQLIGTMMLLDPDECAMVKATVVNKFRGDVSILEPGLDILREKTGVPVAGVVPYVNVDVDDEDSLTDRFDAADPRAVIDIAVVRLPHISNHTDFMALSAMDGVGVRFVGNARSLGKPDMVIIPGTKSTIADLLWMRTSGLEAAVKKLAAAGVPVMGICGGYQMLGQRISDPTGAEAQGAASTAGDGAARNAVNSADVGASPAAGAGAVPVAGAAVDGMGLLPVETVFLPEKRQTQTRGRICQLEGPFAGLSGALLSGYQIHMGRTRRLGGNPFARIQDRTDAAAEPADDGCICGNVCGTYVHGLFDTPQVAQAVVGMLAQRAGISTADIHARDMTAYKNAQYDLLAKTVRDNLDMDFIYRIVRAGL